MEIVVCVKAVPDAETRLRAGPGGARYDAEGVKFVLAGYDESAVEQALLLKESTPGSRVRAVGFGPSPRTDEVLRSALALGCDAATSVEQPVTMAADAVLCARAVGLAIGKHPHELVLCGKQSGDDESGLFGPALGEVLNLPSFGNVTDLKWDAARGRFNFRRSVETGLETVETAPPCVISLQQAWNDPRTAKLPNILKSRKAPIDRVPWTEVAAGLGASAEPRSVAALFELPAPRTGARLIDYKTPEEAARKLVQILREEAKVFP